MTMQEFYKKIGGDYHSILVRLGSENLIKRIAVIFLDDPNFKELEEAFEEKDIEKAFISAHTLKGVSINLSFISLYNASCELVEKLRTGSFEDTKESFLKLKDAYKVTTDALKELSNN